MGESSAANSLENDRYKYVHALHKGHPEAIDVHRIFVPRSSKKKLFFIYSSFFAMLLFATSPFFFL